MSIPEGTEIRVGQKYKHDDGTVSTVSQVLGDEIAFHEEGDPDPDPFRWARDAFCNAHNAISVPTITIVRVRDPMAPLPANPKAAFGATKPSLSLIPSVAMLHEAVAMENGAAKYGPYNWRENAVEARTYIDAAKRHLDAWLDGQECSDDTNPPVHNLGHARACLAILLDAQECGNLIDNRPPRGKSAEVQNRMKAAKIAATEAK